MNSIFFPLETFLSLLFNCDSLKGFEMAPTFTLQDDTETVSPKQYRWRRGVVVIATAQLHSTKPELRLCPGSSPARGVSGIRDGEDL